MSPITLADPVGPQEIAERLHVQTNTVHIWRKRETLPEPACVISGVPLWSWRTVERWAISTGRAKGADDA